MLQANHVTGTPNGSSTGSGSIRLTSKQVRARYGGVDETTLWRWTKNPDVGFPRPIKIGGRRNFWILDELDAFDAKQTAARDGKAA